MYRWTRQDPIESLIAHIVQFSAIFTVEFNSKEGAENNAVALYYETAWQTSGVSLLRHVKQQLFQYFPHGFLRSGYT